MYAHDGNSLAASAIEPAQLQTISNFRLFMILNNLIMQNIIQKLYAYVLESW